MKVMAPGCSISRKCARPVGSAMISAVVLVLVAISAQAQTYSVLYNFSRKNEDGKLPFGGVVLDKAGNLYGTTWHGGTPRNYGTVFKLTPTGEETQLYKFMGFPKDGVQPYAGLVRDKAGNLYGTTSEGGTSGHGTVFKITPTGTETLLYSFNRKHKDGRHPSYGYLVRDGVGDLYGVTESGGAFGFGTVFRVTKTGKEKVLHSFAGGMTDGANPLAGLIREASGNLYGTAANGGAFGLGAVFKVTPGGAETVLYSFAGGPTDGADPRGALIQDSSGNLYGTTLSGGPSNFGTVFKLTPTGEETLLYSFAGGPTDGQGPTGTLARDAAGNIYGTTVDGGPGGFGFGTVFKLTGSGTESVLHGFVGAPTDGEAPEPGLIIDAAGNLYGTTFIGGNGACENEGCGTVFRITP